MVLFLLFMISFFFNWVVSFSMPIHCALLLWLQFYFSFIFTNFTANQPSWQHFIIFTLIFQAKNASFGLDLVALNVQRGRDHGLPGYNAFRELCGLQRVKSFEYLKDLIPEKIVERLKLIYDHVDDIDLFIGGVSEAPVPGALLGPTFRCIVGDQFVRLQHGDRFYYDSASNPGKFTEEQLAEVRKSSLARIHCDNGDHVKLMQPLAFRKPSQM